MAQFQVMIDWDRDGRLDGWSANWLTNGDFSAGEAGWTFVSWVFHQVAGGKLEVYRNGPGAWLHNSVDRAVATGDVLRVTFKAANTGTLDKSFYMIARSADGYDGQVYQHFTISAGTGEQTYSFTGTAGASWDTTWLEIALLSDDNDPALVFDDVQLAVARPYDDVTERVRHIEMWSGFGDSEGGAERVAATGWARMVLDNADGRFSPGNQASPLVGKLLPRREVVIRGGNDQPDEYVLWRGFVDRITPTGGAGEPGACTLHAVDTLALLARQTVCSAHAESLPVVDVIGDVIEAAVGAAVTLPEARFSDNGDRLAHVGRAWQPEHTTARDALRSICAAVYGRFWVARDGAPVFWTRTDQQNPSTSASLTIGADDPLDALDVRLDVANVVNRAQVTVYPVETVGALQTLWQARTVLRLAPGQTRVIYAPFRDENGARCGVVDVATPVATTDYTVNDRADEGGFDYTGSVAFSLSTVVEATRAQITLSNSATGPLYVTLLRLRGKPLRTYDPITVEHADAASQSLYETRTRSLDLTLQADPVFAQSYAQYLVGRFAQPALSAARIVVRNRSQMGGVDVWSLELMDKVLVNDVASGLTNAGHWVRALGTVIMPDSFTVTAHLERADDRQYWLLGRTGYGELGSATRLGF